MTLCRINVQLIQSIFDPVGHLFRRVEADAEHLRVLRGVLVEKVPEPGTLDRSARGIGLRIEPEHDLPAAQSGESHHVAVVVGQLEIGSDFTLLEHARTSQRLDDETESTEKRHWWDSSGDRRLEAGAWRLEPGAGSLEAEERTDETGSRF